jgi:hypothetical protein
MASDARTKIVLELAAEFVEDHVRTRSAQPFGMAEVRRSLGTMLQDAEVTVDLRSADDQWLADWLDRHPFLLKQGSGTTRGWRPGINTGALKQR